MWFSTSVLFATGGCDCVAKQSNRTENTGFPLLLAKSDPGGEAKTWDVLATQSVIAASSYIIRRGICLSLR